MLAYASIRLVGVFGGTSILVLMWEAKVPLLNYFASIHVFGYLEYQLNVTPCLFRMCGPLSDPSYCSRDYSIYMVHYGS